MNNIEAYKMDGLGNDFIIFDKRKNEISIAKDQIIKISNRNSVGCDQVIFIDKDKNSDAFLRFYNIRCKKTSYFSYKGKNYRNF
jgi:diaminopimelate epimerase